MDLVITFRDETSEVAIRRLCQITTKIRVANPHIDSGDIYLDVNHNEILVKVNGRIVAEAELTDHSRNLWRTKMIPSFRDAYVETAFIVRD